MAAPIRTKWHRIIPLIDAGETYFTAPPDGKATFWQDVAGVNALQVRPFIEYVSAMVPKMVMDPSLIALVNKEECAKSIIDMKKAGVMRLPYPTMVVEIPCPDWSSSYICFIRDLRHDSPLEYESSDFMDHEATKQFDFYGMVMHVNRDAEGDYFVMSPALFYMGIEDRNGEPFIGVSAETSGLFPNSKRLGDLVEATYMKDMAVMYYGVFSAALLMRSFGVTHEVIECERLNKKRALSSKEPIPQHTYIRIGRIYKATEGNASEEYEARRSPIPHWRRGHLRHVRYGAGREKLKEKFIEGRIVALRPGDPEPDKPPEYRVVR